MGAALGPCPADDGVLALNTGAPGSARALAQAIDALRHGWPIRIDAENGGPQLVPVETAPDPQLQSGRMLISAARAATLKLANQREAAVPHSPVLIEGGEAFTLDLARAVADPALDLSNPLKGPFRALALPEAAWPATALEIARRAGILPAFLVDPDPADAPVAVVTRATVRPRRLRTFLRSVPAVEATMPDTPGLLAAVGIGEVPVGRQATFSLWRDADALQAFAYESPAHARVVERTRHEGWYGEEWFARLRPTRTSGTWDGFDPLAGALP